MARNNTTPTGTNNVVDPIAARNAALAAAVNANRAIATPPDGIVHTSATPVTNQAPDNAVLAAILAKLNALEDSNKALAAENAALKSGKAAVKAAPKSPITCKNCTWEHDQKTDELVIRVKLSADIIDPDTGAPKVSGTGNSTGVAQLSGSLIDKNGRKVGISLNAYHKL